MVTKKPSPASRKTTADKLEENLSNVLAWSTTWQLTFSPQKTQSLVVSRRHDTDENAILCFNGVPLPHHKKTLKLLGLSFTSNLSWAKHIQTVASKAARLYGMIRRSRRCLSSVAIRNLYKALIRPVVEYGSPIWSTAPRYTLQALDSIEKKCLALRGSSQQSPMDSLSQRRQIASLMVFHSIVFGYAPEALRESVELKRLIFPRDTRAARAVHSRAFAIPGNYRSSRRFDRSFFPRVIRLWNSLSEACVNVADPVRFRHAASLSLKAKNTSP